MTRKRKALQILDISKPYKLDDDLVHDVEVLDNGERKTIVALFDESLKPLDFPLYTYDKDGSEQI